MTTIEQIRMARQEMDASFKRLIESCYEGQGVRAADLEVLQYEVSKTISAQALALVQATQVADENFERAQKLADQVQDNVKHIERLADDNQALTWMLEQKGYKPQKNAFGKIDSFVSGTTVVVTP